ncbi:glycoside hydrolase family 61 protein [Thermothelomyces thermophilus ATCC 42464]|uniref:lytic cellulose monooxygenase (C4-dehydrogenating) n=1 Tax=Thermothelomyces thermophilus (strain ATCC 42464 / BCRC 31852 / DSM 1799) TaxID=573729 RepID=G2QHR1_THET4|nr:glycoside hydrolase family 61 protein [Thermothelomyces thermophilus ATCC 42464]AEO58921.1 glycoside hydrolase family 61 protein [Thermothelomyces thermophilus ATCC 42464]
MSSFTSKGLLSALMGAATVAAHGHVTNIVINGVSYQNFDPFTHPYMQNPPTVVGWTASNTDNGFVGPESFSSPDIICHKSATNAGGHAVVAAGDKVFIQWDTWPESHHGPVIDYLADCGDAGCEKVDKTTLKFFKISESGLLDGTNAPGKWASDTLIANNNSWLVQIPPNIAPGNYVLRHEIIALHSAGQQNGAQNYPQCFNLQVTGSGTQKPSGVLGTELYKATDAGILANIYTSPVTYQIPGPAIISGASAVQQTTSAITASASAITGSATAAPTAATTTAAAAATTTTTAGSRCYRHALDRRLSFFRPACSYHRCRYLQPCSPDPLRWSEEAPSPRP